MANVLNYLYDWFGITGLSDVTTVAELLDVLLRVGIGLGFTLFILRMLFNLTKGNYYL